MLNISEPKVTNILDDGQFYSLRTLKTPGLGRQVARVILIMMGLLILVLFLPWQQNIRGTGQITAFHPQNRPQTVQSAIPGRISEWKVSEGQFVEKGDTILVLEEIKEKYFDPQFLERLQQQLVAKRNGLEAKHGKELALNQQIDALEKAKKVKLQQARNYYSQSLLKLQSDSIYFETTKIQYGNAENIYNRNKSRYEAGNIPLTKFQELESKFQKSKAEVVAAENKWLQSKTEVISTEVNITATEAEYLDKISKARSDLSATIADIHASEGELVKMENEYTSMEIRQQQYSLIAPQSGYIVQAMKAGIGETIKEGEALASVMPSTHDLAIEMYVKAMDQPFIGVGRKARLQFDGWPSLIFSGWPNATVGTFGGIVKVIDRVESKPGMIRILITPDPQDDTWPDQLRMGSGAKGWVMLDDVPIWFELWRLLNGFPPRIYEDPSENSSKSAKK